MSEYYCDGCVICSAQKWIETNPTAFVISFTVAIIALVFIAVWLNNNVTK